ncbi:hypothetical protein MSAN_02102900 [Mycena sanguinolenta]|uniref:Uncharacterized protein n=1 Tax=Mycena sanguinolenta TaxID=230812 RepID=A0A8H6XI18_9AGAR|nr:hypothetical protein MSAN_02102900 [Mycena sanguinolenta]
MPRHRDECLARVHPRAAGPLKVSLLQDHPPAGASRDHDGHRSKLRSRYRLGPHFRAGTMQSPSAARAAAIAAASSGSRRHRRPVTALIALHHISQDPLLSLLPGTLLLLNTLRFAPSVAAVPKYSMYVRAC